MKAGDVIRSKAASRSPPYASAHGAFRDGRAPTQFLGRHSMDMAARSPFNSRLDRGLLSYYRCPAWRQPNPVGSGRMGGDRRKRRSRHLYR